MNLALGCTHISAAGLQGERPLACWSNVQKESWQAGSVTLHYGFAVRAGSVGLGHKAGLGEHLSWMRGCGPPPCWEYPGPTPTLTLFPWPRQDRCGAESCAPCLGPWRWGVWACGGSVVAVILDMRRALHVDCPSCGGCCGCPWEAGQAGH